MNYFEKRSRGAILTFGSHGHVTSRRSVRSSMRAGSGVRAPLPRLSPPFNAPGTRRADGERGRGYRDECPEGADARISPLGTCGGRRGARGRSRDYPEKRLRSRVPAIGFSAPVALDRG